MISTLPTTLPRTAVAANAPVRRSARPRGWPIVSEVSLTACFTLAVWGGCLIVGWLGLALPYPRPSAPLKPPAPIIAEVLNVELATDSLPVPDTAPPPPQSEPTLPPPLLDPVEIAPPPPLIPVAKPSPAIAFALPVEAPARVVEVKQAAPVRLVKPVASASSTRAAATGGARSGQASNGTPRPTTQTLTFGQGKGKQPAPEYPYRAVRDGQEGTVVIRFSVSETGRVLAAEAATPSPWPLLDEAALRVVRARWWFQPGPVRVYQVAIRFELQK